LAKFCAAVFSMTSRRNCGVHLLILDNSFEIYDVVFAGSRQLLKTKPTNVNVVLRKSFDHSFFGQSSEVLLIF